MLLHTVEDVTNPYRNHIVRDHIHDRDRLSDLMVTQQECLSSY